jgi:WxcM-like, C-terminal.
MKNTVDDCKLIHLHNHNCADGILTLSDKTYVPFDIKRIYYLYDIPQNSNRGAHAHKNLYQLILAAAGSFTIELDDGNKKKQFNLSRPSQGLIIVPSIWRNLTDFSSDAIALVLASEYYMETDYIRNYNEFLEYKRNNY